MICTTTTRISPLALWANDHEAAADALHAAIAGSAGGSVSLPESEAHRIHVLLQLLSETPPGPHDLEYVAAKIAAALGGAS